MSLSIYQLKAISESALFKGVSSLEINNYLNEINIYPRTAYSEEHLVEQGEERPQIHIVISGKAVGQKQTADGKVITVNEFEVGDVFGDMLSGGKEKSPVSVIMTEDGEILAIPFILLIRGGSQFLETREKVLRNLFGEISSKYFALMRRLDILLCTSLRGKIARYILGFDVAEGEDTYLPHSREEQARLLNCDRSALSRELSRMQSENIFSLKGRRLKIINREKLLNLAQ